MKVGEPEGVDIPSMSELVCEKPCMLPRDMGSRGSYLLSVTSEEGRGPSLCGLGRSPAGCDLPAVAGLERAKEKGRMSLPVLPTALTVGRTWEMWQGFCLHNFLGGGSFI